MKHASLIVGVFVSICFALYALMTPLSQRGIDWKVYDLYSEHYSTPAPSNNIIIVDIDDQSLAALGQWPWPRYRLAEALRLIVEASPSTVLVDILLSEKDRSSLINIQDQFAAELGVKLEFPNLPQGLDDNDAYLSEVIYGSPVVLASVLSQNNVYQQGLCATQNIAPSTIKLAMSQPDQLKGIICPLDQFYTASASTGFTNAAIDADGLLRRVPIIRQHAGQLFPGLSLAGLMVMSGGQLEFGHNVFGDFISVNGREIPLDRNGNALVNFRGKGRSYQTVPILKLLQGSISPELFKGKIVLMGATASALNDIVSTNLDSSFPGIESHAVLIDNVINDDVVVTPLWSEILEAIVIGFTGVLMSFLITRKALAASSIAGLIVLSILLIAPWVLLNYFQIYISPYLSLLNMLIVFALTTAVKHYTAEKHLASVLLSIANTNFSIIESMATIAELRDAETGGHISRTKLYVKALARQLQTKDKYKHEVTDDYIEYLHAAAPLHDIGKVGIPDYILRKPGKLTEDEFKIMKTHAQLGGKILKQIEAKVGPSPYLNVAIEIASGHHEKWNGQGYPHGLKNEQIPLSARLMAIADVFDALSTKRVYKEAMGFENTIAFISEASGSHFDPSIVSAFLEIQDEFIQISNSIND